MNKGQAIEEMIELNRQLIDRRYKGGRYLKQKRIKELVQRFNITHADIRLVIERR